MADLKVIHADLAMPKIADPKHAIDSQLAAISPEWESEGRGRPDK
jgi:hypothetical protein